MCGIVGYTRNKQVTLLTLVLLTIFCAGIVSAQQTPNNIAVPCENYGKKGFEGEAINLNLANKDLKDILNLITKKFGCNFVVDKSVGKIDLSININRVPWNVALEAVLRSQDLGIQINGKVLRVAEIGILEKEEKPTKIIIDVLDNNSPLVTEEIKPTKVSEKGTVDLKAFQKFFSRYLTKRGSIEIDDKSNTLKLTDVRENLDGIKNLINILDNNDDNEQLLLYTEFIKLKRLLSGTSPPACNYGSDIKEKHTGLSQVINKMLSRRGAVETDSKSNSLIITDTKERVSLILKQIKDWDNSNLTLEEIMKDFESKNR